MNASCEFLKNDYRKVFEVHCITYPCFNLSKCDENVCIEHDDLIKWKEFPCQWPLRGISTGQR